jgi:RND superfamily putative drug exporter
MTTATTTSPTASQPPARPSRPAEESALARLAGWCHDHRWWVLLIWLVALVGTNVVAQSAGSAFSNNLAGPPGEVQQILDANFPGQAGSPADVVVTTTGAFDSAANQARTAQLTAALSRLPHVAAVVSPFAPEGAAQRARDGHIGFVRVQFDQQAGDLPTDAIKKVVTTAQSFQATGYRIALGGEAIGLVSGEAPGPSEGIGIFAAIIIMLLAFGSVVAMGLPIITALFGIAIAFAVLDLLSHVVTTPVFAPEMMAMIGLGVGIDYALFVVTRFRQGLAEGREPREAVAVSLATSGRSVLFAGTTVILSLLGLFLLQLPFMRGLAVGAIAAVVLVMAAALTLLPAMLGFSGRAIDKLHVPGLLQSAAEPSARGFWYRWSRTVQRRPWVAGTAALLVLVCLALPLFSMRLAFTDAGNDPPGTTTRQAFDSLSTGFGPGFNGPLIIAATVPAGGHATVDTLASTLRRTPGIVFVSPAQFSASGRDAVLVAYPNASPQSAETEALVRSLRDRVIPEATAGTGVVALVGGETAGSVDASSYLSSRLPLVIGAVLLLSFLLLMAVFRSLAIPVKAVVVNLLSVGAAYGVIVAVFQWGWLGGVIGIGSTGPIDPWIPLMMFTILFGLSMDYEVFLLSRMREEWRKTHDNSSAVADGLAKTARVITAAAAIMVCVFGSFVIGDPLHVLKVFGLGLAAAIFIDATLVRMVLVPSVMELLGDANWWMPSWLDRVVPHLGVEVDVDESPGSAPVSSSAGVAGQARGAATV